MIYDTTHGIIFAQNKRGLNTALASIIYICTIAAETIGTTTDARGH